ncbi:hypothetical protein JCM15765_07960 [Paradesulfitobacterium aromaticivorans]
MYVVLGVAVLLIMLGILVKYLKWYWLISGYNTLPAAEKEKVDAEGLGNFTGNLLFALAGIFIISAVLSFMGYRTASFTVIMLVFPAAIFGVLKGQKYSPESQGRKAVLIAVSLSSVIFVIIISLLIWGSREQSVIVSAENIKVTGMYGTQIPLNEIKDVSLKEGIPKVLRKTNGLDNGNILKGNFETLEYGRVKLFLNLKQNKCVLIYTRGGQYYLLNFAEEQRTKDLYQNILLFWHQ